MIRLAGSRRWQGICPTRQRVDSTRPAQRLVGSFRQSRTVTYRLVMLTERRIDHSAVEQNLRRVGDLVEMPQRLLEVLIVVGVKGLDPGLNFLYLINVHPDKPRPDYLTCFNDIPPTYDESNRWQGLTRFYWVCRRKNNQAMLPTELRQQPPKKDWGWTAGGIVTSRPRSNSYRDQPKII